MTQNKKSIFSIFGNPGQIIRVFALIVFFAGVIGSFAYAIDASYVEAYYSRYYYQEAEFRVGQFLIIFLAGSAGSWVSGLIFMAIGNTVLNIQKMADAITGGKTVIPQPAQEEKKAPAASSQYTVQPVHIEKNKSVSSSEGKDVAEQIKELAEFYKTGALTEEEFNRKKAELLKKL